MELMVFPLNCLLRPKCLALLLITMAIALIGLQKLILLRQSFTPSSVTTVIQRSFEPMVGTSISGSNCTENNKCSVHVFEYVMNNSLSKASPNVSSDGNKEVTGWLEDDADYSQHSEDGFFNPSESTSNDRRSDIDIMQGILDVESNAPVSKLETGNLQVSMGKASNQSMDFVPDKSTRLTNHSKVFSHVNDGQVKPSVHANVSYSTGDEKCGSSTTRDGWNGSSLWYENKEKLLCYPNCTRLQNASTMLWSYPPEAFELLLEKERGVPSMSFSEMNVQLTKNLASADSNPYFHSAADKEILDAKTRIWSTAVRRKHRDLYPPVFRNISFFKSSYELMEHTLKVYIYSEGEKPVFHQPGLHGIYASEGWFMKLLNASKFHVKEPRKVHLFYLPFSSSILRYTKAKDSHDILKLASYLKEYLDLISRKYPFWNRTGGMDHFFAACHDWAPYITRPHMNVCIRAFCNADVSESFELGKDVSLPETYIHVHNPDKDIGGKPPKERTTFAFFTGVQHSYLRKILLQLWENKDPKMKIFAAAYRHATSRKEYANHMRASKYCICPRGYEVNSPRVVEAILYGCVPVVISDNFVPPFFQVLDWTSFSIFVAEKDIRRLRDILVSIPERRYLSLQKGVRKVQRHFLWHHKPAKYDMFHMVLHSIWLSRLNRT